MLDAVNVGGLSSVGAAGAVVISGCSSGVGRESAIELARAGYRVFAGVRGESDAADLRDLGLPELLPLSLDVAEAESVRAARSQVERLRTGRPLVGLVNNAAVAQLGPVEAIPIEAFERVLQVDLVGPIRMIQAFLPMLRVASGRIVNVGSGEAFLALPVNAAYGLAKFGLEALSDSLRMELAPCGVGVSVVEPGETRTPGLRKAIDQIEQLSQGVSPDACPCYQSAIAARRRMLDRGGAMDPKHVAAAIVRALTTSRPRARYFVGSDVMAAVALGCFLPAIVRDWALRRLFGFPGPRVCRGAAHDRRRRSR